MLEIIKTMNPNFKIWSIASDEARSQVMGELLKKMKNINSKQAFDKSADKANKLFYEWMANTIRDISLSK